MWCSREADNKVYTICEEYENKPTLCLRYFNAKHMEMININTIRVPSLITISMLSTIGHWLTKTKHYSNMNKPEHDYDFLEPTYYK